MSLSKRILKSKRPFTFFHTWSVARELLQQAIDEQKSMDLDVCVDDDGRPYLGHSREYHEKSGEPYFVTMPLWEAVDMIADSSIAAMVDVKHYDAWPVVEEVVARIGPERCLVCALVTELKFEYNRESDFATEWSPIERLRLLKRRFPSITTTPGTTWLPKDLLLSGKHHDLLRDIRQTLKDNDADTVCLAVPDNTISDRWLRYFLEEDILLHVVVDNTDTNRLSEMYIGETDFLARASQSSLLPQWRMPCA